MTDRVDVPLFDFGAELVAYSERVRSQAGVENLQAIDLLFRDPTLPASELKKLPWHKFTPEDVRTFADALAGTVQPFLVEFQSREGELKRNRAVEVAGLWLSNAVESLVSPQRSSTSPLTESQQVEFLAALATRPSEVVELRTPGHSASSVVKFRIPVERALTSNRVYDLLARADRTTDLRLIAPILGGMDRKDIARSSRAFFAALHDAQDDDRRGESLLQVGLNLHTEMSSVGGSEATRFVALALAREDDPDGLILNQIRSAPFAISQDLMWAVTFFQPDTRLSELEQIYPPEAVLAARPQRYFSDVVAGRKPSADGRALYLSTLLAREGHSNAVREAVKLAETRSLYGVLSIDTFSSIASRAEHGSPVLRREHAGVALQPVDPVQVPHVLTFVIGALNLYLDDVPVEKISTNSMKDLLKVVESTNAIRTLVRPGVAVKFVQHARAIFGESEKRPGLSWHVQRARHAIAR